MKFNELPTHDRKGRIALQVENAVIKSVSISNEDHGCLTAWLYVEFDGGGCGFGGYMLGRRDEDNVKMHKGHCAEFLNRCMKTVGQDRWEDLEGRPLRVLHEGLGGGIVAVGHYLRDEWFCPRKEWSTGEDD